MHHQRVIWSQEHVFLLVSYCPFLRRCRWQTSPHQIGSPSGVPLHCPCGSIILYICVGIMFTWVNHCLNGGKRGCLYAKSSYLVLMIGAGEGLWLDSRSYHRAVESHYLGPVVSKKCLPNEVDSYNRLSLQPQHEATYALQLQLALLLLWLYRQGFILVK